MVKMESVRLYRWVLQTQVVDVAFCEEEPGHWTYSTDDAIESACPMGWDDLEADEVWCDEVLV
jgi:hypothetical protein